MGWYRTCKRWAGTALVGDPHTVAERIKEYESLGIDTFVLSGYPHLEEAYEVAELLFPLLKDKKKEENKIVGEMIADAYALKIVRNKVSLIYCFILFTAC